MGHLVIYCDIFSWSGVGLLSIENGDFMGDVVGIQ